MLKKIGRDFIIIFCVAALFVSTHRPTMAWLCNLRDNDNWWGLYQCKHGDLVAMSGLDIVGAFNEERTRAEWPFRKAPFNGPRNTVLYLYGDSHTFKLTDTLFAGLAGYHYISRYSGATTVLDRSKKNVLLIEMGEQAVREYFSTLRMFNELKDSVPAATGNIFNALPKQTYGSWFPPFTVGDFFNKNINQNLECNLFNYNAFMGMFQSKAALNYYLFNRASGDVVISDDRQFLFYSHTASNNEQSGYRTPVGPEEIDHIVENINAIYAHYSAIGFDHVFLSIIPNSPTIMQPAGYNNLIPLIHHHPKMQMPIIDAYEDFRTSKTVLYWHGDTHWNYLGVIEWLKLVNDQLRKIAAEKK